MNTRSGATGARCLLVWLAATTLLGGLGWLLLPDLVDLVRALRSPGIAGRPFEPLLAWLCAVVAAVGAAWLWVATTMVTIEAAGRGSRHRVPGVPAVLRRVVLGACGVALAGGLAAPATATPGDLHRDRSGAAAAALLRGLPLPDRAPGHLVPVPRSAPADTDAVVVVRPGDTLWDLAGGTPAWHRLYELNREVIGSDPDLIVPGQRLRQPR